VKFLQKRKKNVNTRINFDQLLYFETRIGWKFQIEVCLALRQKIVSDIYAEAQLEGNNSQKLIGQSPEESFEFS
jgi:hypothetical protein